MERERAEISVWPPALGMVAGAAMMAGGALLAVNIDRKGGSVFALAFGLPITLVSTLVLAKRVRRRRAIERELSARSLLPALARGSLGFSF